MWISFWIIRQVYIFSLSPYITLLHCAVTLVSFAHFVLHANAQLLRVFIPQNVWKKTSNRTFKWVCSVEREESCAVSVGFHPTVDGIFESGDPSADWKY